MAILKDKPATVDIALQAMTRVIGYQASKYARNHRDRYEDLFNEGVIGLCVAYDRFDPSKGAAFSTYAYQWIFAAVKDAATKDWKVKNNTASQDISEYTHLAADSDVAHIEDLRVLDVLKPVDKLIVSLRREGYSFREISEMAERGDVQPSLRSL